MSPRLLFIADLHLSEDHPILTQAFLQLLHQMQDKPTDLYILGDWFNAWLDDRDTSTWLNPIITTLQNFTRTGNHIYFLCGNRDFVLGQTFLNRFGGTLLHEPHTFTWQGLRVSVEHGDSLCTDDHAYQRYKTIIRQPLILSVLKSLPFSFKRRIANFFRHQSQERQHQSNYGFIDVNPQAVENRISNIDILIHGHTHRPEIQLFSNGKRRIVLGDWRERSGSAQILLLEYPERIALTDWHFDYPLH